MSRRPSRTELIMVAALTICTAAQIGLTIYDLLSA